MKKSKLFMTKHIYLLFTSRSHEVGRISFPGSEPRPRTLPFGNLFVDSRKQEDRRVFSRDLGLWRQRLSLPGLPHVSLAGTQRGPRSNCGVGLKTGQTENLCHYFVQAPRPLGQRRWTTQRKGPPVSSCVAKGLKDVIRSKNMLPSF